MFLRILKQKNKSGLAYKMAIVKSVRESGKVRHKILLYIGTFAEKYRHDLDYQKKFLKIMQEKFAQTDFKPYEKTSFKQKIYDLFPEMYQTMSFEREMARRKRQ